MRAKSSRREFLRLGGLTSLGLISWPGASFPSSFWKENRLNGQKRVIIVGAGLAGLSAAYQLNKAGFQVDLLEAQMMPGGRVRTLRSPFADNFYAEAGAGRFPESHDLTFHFIKEFGLEVASFYPMTGNLTTYTGGSHLYNTYSQQRNIQKVNLPLTPTERQLGENGLFEQYVLPVLQKIGDPTQSQWLNSELQALDQMTWTGFLRKQGMSDAAIKFFNVGAITLADGHEVSALWLLRDMLSGGKKYKIKGGNDQLPRAFAKQLENNISYGCEVTRIEQFENQVSAIYRNGGGEQVIKGDYLVMAVPFSVAKKIVISPELPTPKAALIRDLQYASASRATLQFKSRSWESKGLNGFATSDDPLQVWHPTFDQAGHRGILQSYIRLSLSRKLGQIAEKERVDFVLKKIERIFPGIAKDFEGGLVKCWDEDPWAKGAAAVHAPGQLSAMANIFDRSEGRVYFAGDHLSPWPAWMQGALYSGLKVAEQIDSA